MDGLDRGGEISDVKILYVFSLHNTIPIYSIVLNVIFLYAYGENILISDISNPYI